MSNILVIEDEPDVNQSICSMLREQNFTARAATSIELALEEYLAPPPRLVILNIRIGETTAAELCEQLRPPEARIPLIVLSFVPDEIDKVLWLELGADDYLVKPFSMRELLARIRAILRRTASRAEKIVRFGDVQVNLERRLITRRGDQVKFTPAEYNLLLFFLQNADRALTRDTILNSVWGYEAYLNTRTLDVHVVRLRQKLESDPNVPRHVLTIHGLGYRFVM